MPTASIFINDKYRKRNGDSAVYLVVHTGGKTLKFNTGVSCSPNKWDYENARLKGRHRKAKDKNLIIEESLARINDIFVRYRLQHVRLTPEDLKKEWKNPSRLIDFYAWMNETIIERRFEITDSSIRQHFTLLNKLKEFKAKLSFTEIDAEFIEQFRRFLKVIKKNDLNTIHNNLKIFKAYLNIAKRQKIIKQNPFDVIRLRRSKPDRIFLSEFELQKMLNLYEQRTLTENRQKILRHFLFMCFTGLRISDLKEITFNEIVDNHLVFFPVKTRGTKRLSVKVPLISYAWKLIHDEGKKSGNIFKLFSEQKMNVSIKKIAPICGINKKLSNHSGRHTFATLYMLKTKDLAGLQRLLGHSNIQETMVYVHITDEILNVNMQVFENSIFA
jgi:site-specific recombinase XerD